MECTKVNKGNKKKPYSNAYAHSMTIQWKRLTKPTVIDKIWKWTKRDSPY